MAKPGILVSPAVGRTLVGRGRASTNSNARRASQAEVGDGMNCTTKLLIAAVSVAAQATAAADDDRRGGHSKEFVGVFYPAIVAVTFDAQRCPDTSHPILFSFAGTAQTTLGRAQLEQSHCEDFEHTSFRRGVETLTFADGTQLFGRYQGDLLPTPTTSVDGLLIVSGTYRNTGGTAGLSRARGKGISAGTVDTRTGAAVITVSGTL